tara:strand:+ start:199 stop:549 length:351 start_codon:yes stop_codon:yes gene_type:complete
MTKNQITYSDLSNKELELLKDLYINLKVKSMNIIDLKEFVSENISLQIKNTIGNDEELEAWREMEEFFKDEFDSTIRDIQLKVRSKQSGQGNINIDQMKPEIEDKDKEKKIDMWED